MNGCPCYRYESSRPFHPWPIPSGKADHVYPLSFERGRPGRWLPSVAQGLFKGQTIEIAVSEAEDASEDETAYLLQNPENPAALAASLGECAAWRPRDGRVRS